MGRPTEKDMKDSMTGAWAVVAGPKMQVLRAVSPEVAAQVAQLEVK